MRGSPSATSIVTSPSWYCSVSSTGSLPWRTAFVTSSLAIRHKTSALPSSFRSATNCSTKRRARNALFRSYGKSKTVRDTVDGFLAQASSRRTALRSTIRAECSQPALYPPQVPPTHRSHGPAAVEYLSSAPSATISLLPDQGRSWEASSSRSRSAPAAVSSRRAASDGFRRISDPPSAVSVPRARSSTWRHDESMNCTPERSRTIVCLGPRWGSTRLAVVHRSPCRSRREHG